MTLPTLLYIDIRPYCFNSGVNIEKTSIRHLKTLCCEKSCISILEGVYNFSEHSNNLK